MANMVLQALFSFTTVISLLSFITGQRPLPKLLLVSMDGFKHDYLELPGLKPEDITNFKYVITNGVRASQIINVFPTVTYPNHYTLITGLYPESHGIVHNRFYDRSPEVMSHFWFDNRRDNFDPVWYDVGAEPIYVTNKKAGMKRNSGSVLWPCGLGKVKEIAPDRIVPNADPFNKTDFKVRVDYVMNWFKDKENPINLGLLYFNEPDETAHATGAGSEEVIKKIIELNDALGYLFEKLKDAKLFEEMNIIITADHGFTNVSEIVDLNEYDIIEKRDYHSGSEFKNHITVQLFPTNVTDMVQKYQKSPELQKKVSMYVKNDPKDKYLKETLHYHDSIRVAPVVMTGNVEGVYIVKNQTVNASMIGMHGMDPYKFESMRPFFLAMGPAFKTGHTVDSFNSVDIYPLMCHILGLTPAPNNGSLSNVKGLLRMVESEKESFTITSISFLLLVGTSVAVAGIYAICACHNARKRPRILRSTQRPSGVTALPTHHLLDSEGDDDEF